MKLVVHVSKEGAPETHRQVPFPKVYFWIMHYLKLVGKQGKIIGTYILQLSTVDSNFYQM